MADNGNGRRWGGWVMALMAVVLTAVFTYLASANTFEARLSTLEGRAIDPSRVSVLENQQVTTDRRLERIELKIDELLYRTRP